ncbi:MAG TPA: hypothetical protein VG407_04060 [Caulobacteraceae bacterium]|jgi:DNA-directed RNA polymerase subunit K/omega|nr:hypothetical protein [Caulobacteraceae bacterium]
MKLAALVAASLAVSTLAAAPALAQKAGPAPATPVQPPVVDTDPNMVDPTPDQAKAAEDAVRAAIEEFRSGKIDYSTMTDELHAQLQPQAEHIHNVLAGLGEVKTLRAVIMDKEAKVIFLRAEFSNGAAYDWAVQIAPDGKLAQLALRPSQD